MKKMTAAMAALGVVAGLGAAALPLASYASEATVPVTAVIDDALSITLTDASTADALGADGVLIEGVTPGNTNVSTRSIAVTVNGNDQQHTYKLTLEDRSTDNALISAAGDRIEAVSGSSMGGSSTETSAWGFSTSTSNPTTAPTSWKAVPARGGTPAQLLTGTGNTGTVPANGKATTYVTFGVFANENQQPGRYTTDVVFTATAQN